MQATAELQVVPIGAGVSVRQEVGRAVELLRARGLTVVPHASGTNIEGELADILAAVEQVHDTLHQQGTVRLVSYLKLETRSDRPSTLAGKQL